MTKKRMTLAAGAAVLALLTAACGSSSPKASSGTSSKKGVDAATATSVDDFGGMDQLVAAAKKEGKLNVITLPAK